MPAQLGIHGFDRLKMLMFRATSAKPDVIIVTIHDPFRLLDHMVQHSSTPGGNQRTITRVGSWTLSVCRPIICSSVLKRLFFLEFAAYDC